MIKFNSTAGKVELKWNFLRWENCFYIIYNHIIIYPHHPLSIAIPKVQLCWGRACGPNQKEPHFEARTVIQPEMTIEHQRHRVATLVMCEARCKLHYPHHPHLTIFSWCICCPRKDGPRAPRSQTIGKPSNAKTTHGSPNLANSRAKRCGVFPYHLIPRPGLRTASWNTWGEGRARLLLMLDLSGHPRQDMDY